ncbi:MAG: class I SAM-dependent methyltransferase [Tenericutes bacterium]|nr:class I SAM-dependent methyltransferase [Mycoplasmatota bacterium]
MSHYFENDLNLKSEIREINYKYESSFFIFYSDNGVFSKKNIDYGSKLLLESYLKEEEENKKVLDLGCGYGFIGIVISIVKKSNVDLIDINKRAVHLTNRNIKRYKEFNGKAFISDAYENITDKYDTIITNPPIRVGKEKLLEIINGSFEHLNKNGSLYFVIRKDQGALSIKKGLEETKKVELISKSKGYFVFKIKKV